MITYFPYVSLARLSMMLEDDHMIAHLSGCSAAEKVVRQRKWTPEKALLGAAARAGSRPIPGLVLPIDLGPLSVD